MAASDKIYTQHIDVILYTTYVGVEEIADHATHLEVSYVEPTNKLPTYAMRIGRIFIE